MSLIPNTTPVPNVIVDRYMRKLSDTSFRVLMIIIRKTYGWIENPETGMRKEEDWLAYSQLKEFSGRANTAVSNALRELESFNLIEIRNQEGKILKTKQERSGKKLYYRFKTSLDSGQVTLNLSGKRNPQSEHTKETNTKDIVSINTNNRINPDVDRILLDFKFTTGLSKPADEKPRHWAYLFAKNKGKEHFVKCTKYLMEIWPNVTITKLETIYRNFPLYERDKLKKSETPKIDIDWDDPQGPTIEVKG